EMTPDELEKISVVAKINSHHPGEEIFIQGEKARALYVIKFGSVKIQQSGKSGDEVNITTLGTGSHFGEMAFVDGEPRSATVAAIEPTEIVTLDFEALRGVLD